MNEEKLKLILHKTMVRNIYNPLWLNPAKCLLVCSISEESRTNECSKYLKIYLRGSLKNHWYSWGIYSSFGFVSSVAFDSLIEAVQDANIYLKQNYYVKGRKK